MTIIDERALALWLPLLQHTVATAMGQTMADALKTQQLAGPNAEARKP